MKTVKQTSMGEGTVLRWLQDWENLINAVDFEKARPLFSESVVSFGTFAEILNDRNELEVLQWRKVWPTIADFRFEEPMIVLLGGDPAIAMVLSLWHSKGKTADGGWYARKGRATLILKEEKGELRCIHSHLSMEPGIPAICE